MTHWRGHRRGRLDYLGMDAISLAERHGIWLSGEKMVSA